MSRPSGEDDAAPDRVLSSAARELYLQAVRSDGKVHAEAPVGSDAAVHGRALRELVGLRLLERDFADERVYVAVDPQQAAATLGATLHSDAMVLLTRAVALPGALRDLAHAYQVARHLEDEGSDAVERIHGKMRINQSLDGLLDGCQEELITVQPGGARPGNVLLRVIDRDLAVLSRGGTIRTLYQPTARYDAATRHYVQEITGAGGQVRTLDDAFDRLIVVDRHTAAIPVAGEPDQAAFVHDGAVIAYLVAAFERHWARAMPFSGERSIPPEVTDQLQLTILNMLAAGAGQPQIARTLGLSVRTAARHMAELREQYAVATQYQLGYAVARAQFGQQTGPS